MATNKNALLRYQVLDRCFRNPGKRYFIDDLLEECKQALYEFNGEQSGVQVRQLRYDITFMESDAGWSAPLERHRVGRKVYYRYSDLDFSINNQPLNETEINHLQEVLLILSKFKGLPQLEELKAIIPKLQKGTDLNELHPVASFDENPYLKGSNYIGELFNAILYHKVLEISYQDFKADQPYLVTFHPYHLKQYNNRWFVFGYNEYNDISDWNLALDRILSIEESTKKYRSNKDIDWNEYFEDIIGVTKPKGSSPLDIVLWVDSATAPYIITKPLHGSQRRPEDGETGGVLIKLNLIPNFEFYQVILSFGNKIKVTSPTWVAKKVKETLKLAIEIYGDD